MRSAAIAAVGREAEGLVMIVEDHVLLAKSLALALTEAGLRCQIAEAGDPDRVLRQVMGARPKLVMLDLDLGTFDGLDLIRPLRRSGATVLIVTACEDQARLAEALALGAWGWVAKSEPFERLLEAAALAFHEQFLVPEPRRAELVLAGRERLAADRELLRRMARLTGREREVLAALSAGKPAQQIADEFVVSLGTVRSHIRAILIKMEVSTQLAAVAMSRRLPPPMRRRAGLP